MPAAVSVPARRDVPGHPAHRQPQPYPAKQDAPHVGHTRFTRYLAGTQSSNYFCRPAYQQPCLGPHNPSRSARPPGRLHWNLHAILSKYTTLECCRALDKAEDTECQSRPRNWHGRPPHVLHHSQALKLPRLLALALDICLLFSVPLLKESWSQGRQYANTRTSHRSLKPRSPASSQPIIQSFPSLHSHCHGITTCSQVSTTGI